MLYDGSLKCSRTHTKYKQNPEVQDTLLISESIYICSIEGGYIRGWLCTMPHKWFVLVAYEVRVEMQTEVLVKICFCDFYCCRSASSCWVWRKYNQI